MADMSGAWTNTEVTVTRRRQCSSGYALENWRITNHNWYNLAFECSVAHHFLEDCVSIQELPLKVALLDLLNIHKIPGGSQLLSATAGTFQQSGVSPFFAHCTHILQHRNTCVVLNVCACCLCWKKSKLHRSESKSSQMQRTWPRNLEKFCCIALTGLSRPSGLRGGCTPTLWIECWCTETMLVMNAQNNYCSCMYTGQHYPS